MSAHSGIRGQGVPFVFGSACLLALAAVIEGLIRFGLINPFIVPKPTDVVMSFERIIVEENILPRFLLTCGEALAASIAKDMVVYLRRSSRDPELSPFLGHRRHTPAAVHKVQDAISAEP